ncbi:response regulator [Flavobacterium limi]|uniref:Response regulatory domain-containing protein n=1 Tax=Flavobacterium limi TaxID=2045105 RepID=A0ABQ1UVU5_9FLAO|nr:response regulator [Flavobacterium limi]GGF28272.1 hypothetical protein GCM10011518_41990 [Flavobacterium limi]
MSSKEILVVDDDNDDIEIFVEAINSLNKDLICRSSFNPAKTLADLSSCEKLPDLILLDYNMPSINGLEFIQQLKADQKLSGIEVVMMSTPNVELMVPWLLKNNITARYIAKPDSFEKLKIILNNIL